MLDKIKSVFQNLKKVVGQVIKDCATSANGDYDPARVAGYAIVLLGGLEFLVLFAWSTIQNGKFDGLSFATGLGGVAAALTAAAAGVWIKKSTEIEPPKQEPPKPAEPPKTT